jgi:hypothetical protein
MHTAISSTNRGGARRPQVASRLPTEQVVQVSRAAGELGRALAAGGSGFAVPVLAQG